MTSEHPTPADPRPQLLSSPLPAHQIPLGTQMALEDVPTAETFASRQTRPRHHGAIRKVLSAAPWRLVEVVALVGLPDRSGLRVLVVMDPETAMPEQVWLGRDRGLDVFPPLEERTWAYLAVDPGLARAVVASVDRRELWLLDAKQPLTTAAQAWHFGLSTLVDRWRITLPHRIPGHAVLPESQVSRAPMPRRR